MLRSHPPTADADRLAADALRLKPSQRARLVDILIESLPPDPEIDAEWDREAARRLREIETGRVKPVPLKDALKRAFAPPRRKK